MKCFKIFFLLGFISLSVNASERLAADLQEQMKEASQEESAQILRAIDKTEVSPDGRWASRRYYSIQINNADAARDYGRISIPFDHFYFDLELEFANVLAPGGDVKSLKNDAVQERVGGSQDFYNDQSYIVFSLPDVKPGSILEFQYKIVSKNLRMPHLFATLSNNYWYQPTVSGQSARIDPVQFASFELTIPRALDFYWKNLGEIKGEYDKRRSGDLSVHRWSWSSMPAVPVEAYMPWYENNLSRVRVSTSKDWRDVDRWAWGLVQNKFAETQTISRIASELVDQDANADKKIRAVYQYLQDNVRYVYAHLGRGGYEPHFADDVLQQNYGDCKDQTILAIALLNKLGIEAYPALVVTPYADRPSMDLVNLYFDHMIVWIPGQGGDGMWLDTTGDRLLYPGVSNALLGQPVFIVDGRGGRKTSIDKMSHVNSAHAYMDYRINDKKELFMEMRVNFSGSNEQWFRQVWTHSDDRETALQGWLTSAFRELGAEVDIEGFVYDADSLWYPVSVRAEFRFGKVPRDASGAFKISTTISQLLALLNDVNSLGLPSERKGPWRNNMGQDLSLSVTVTGSEEDVVSIMSSGLNEINNYFSIEQSVDKIDSGYTINMRYQRNPLYLDTVEYAEFYQANKRITELGSWVAQVAPAISAVTHRGSLDTIVLSQSKTPLMDRTSEQAILMSEIKTLIESADFAAARDKAKDAVGIDAKDGEAWYLLGVAQGFSMDIEAAKEAFGKARSLGYRP